MIRKRMISILFAVLLLCSISAPAFAVSYSTEMGKVWFNEDGKTMGNDFETKSLTESLVERLSTLQPGDDATFTVTLENRYKTATNWFMTSEIIKSLEEGTASGGGYTYDLRYMNLKTGVERVLYSSNTVGGDDSQGLLDVNEAIISEYLHDGIDYFYLDNLESYQQGLVTLKVALDGMTQRNSYQDRLADLRMNWAVQVQDQNTYYAPKTGDENNLFPYYIAMVLSGLLFLYFALDSITDRMYKVNRKKGGA